LLQGQLEEVVVVEVLVVETGEKEEVQEENQRARALSPPLRIGSQTSSTGRGDALKTSSML
jgi:hypothetical protein